MVIFEGLDKTGKSSLKKDFEVISNFKYICFDRGFLSSLAYSYRYHREQNLDPIFYSNLQIPIILVYCTASDPTIKERLKKADETEINVEKDKEAFTQALIDFTGERYKNAFDVKIVLMSTEGKTSTEAAFELLEKTKDWDEFYNKSLKGKYRK